MLVTRTVLDPGRQGLRWEERWGTEADGLYCSWLRGREKAIAEPALAAAASRGELPPLAWKGGLKDAIKGQKFGSLYYLATWQGLRGEDLKIETDNEIEHVCTRTGVRVVFTGDLAKVAEEAS